MLLFIAWSVLLLLLGMPCGVRGASDLLRAERQPSYAEDWSRGSKGTDVLSQLSGITARRYKHGEPPPGRSGDGSFGKLLDQSELKGQGFSPQLGRAASEEVGLDQLPYVADGFAEKAAGGKGGRLQSVESTPRNLERLRFASVLRDCLRIKCSPLANFDVKQQQQEADEIPPFISKPDSPTFQGPVSSAPLVAINPPFLEWGSQPVFAPSTLSLTVVNTCNSTRLRVFQPFSTDALQFYTAHFEERIVDPGDELSIPITFLPRALGVADAMLIVQTSAGGFLVQAQGKGVGSPYEVQPLQGLRVTSGETLQHTITLHNPHDEVLRVGEVTAWPNSFAEYFLSNSNAGIKGGPCEREVVSLGGVSRCADGQSGVLHLATEHPDPRASILGGAAVKQLRPPGQLEIGPHSSNPIAEFEFEALKADRYSGSLHIKLLRGMQESDDVLILPIDVQVCEAKGDASPVEPVVDVLEFGILTKQDQVSRGTVVLYNPGTDPVQLEDISLLSQDENIVRIEYRKGLVLPPNSETQVAAITYMGLKETIPSGLFDCHPGEFRRDRKLIVRTNSSVSPRVEVPYRALVFHGSVECDSSQGSVGFVPERSEGNGGGRLSVLEGGALSEQRVHFENGLSFPLLLFLDLERTARTRSRQNPEPLLSLLTSDSGCCHESSAGHFTVSVGEPSIGLHPELVYPVVQIGSEELQWVNVTNPSEKPLYVQLLVSPKAEANDGPRRHHGMNPGDPDPGFSERVVSDSSDSTVACHFLESPSNAFFLAEGAVDEVVIEPHGTSVLGPVVFRPFKRCLWTGLLSLWNNLTEVEWISLWGTGGSGRLTFLDGEYRTDLLQLDFNVTQSSMISGIMEDPVAGFLDAKKANAVCSQRVSRGFQAKNTGDIHLDVTAVELVGGGCSAYGFEVDPCKGFSLAPGQSAELFVSFRPDLTSGVFQRDLQFITSTGVVLIPILASLPEHIFPLCSEMAQSTNLERGFLYLAVIALVVVLGVFCRMLFQEMSLSQEQVSTSGNKSISQHKVGGRQASPNQFSLPHAVVLTKTSNSAVTAGRLKCSSGEPEVQSRTGDGTGASGPGRPREGMKGIVRALKGVADSFTATMGSSNGSEESKGETAPPPGLPGLRVKIPNSAGLNAQKPNLPSPMREAASPSSNHLRKGMAEKRSHSARFDGLQAKISPEPLEESVPIPAKASPVPKSPKLVVGSSTSVFIKQGADAEGSQLLSQQILTLPINSGLVTGPPTRSPRKGSQLNQSRQVFSPKPQPLAPKSQPQSSSSGIVDKDKGKRRKRRSNMGTVKQESVSKGRSGSSSPSSSPASPATPASPSRPISPFHHSDMQPSITTLAPPGFPSIKDSGGAAITNVPQLSKLDLVVDRHSSAGKLGSGNLNEPSSPLVYRRSESLSVDVASTALREMAQAKATDLSWSTLSGKGNRLTERTNDGTVGKQGVPKDWATVARKASVETTVTAKEEDITDGRNWDRMSRVTQSGHGCSAGPALTPSATFPRRQDRGSGFKLNFTVGADDEQAFMKPIGGSPSLPPFTIPPAARAPGAKILYPAIGWAAGGEYGVDGTNSLIDILDKQGDKSSSLMSGFSSEDERVYDIWGDHFGEISRCSTQQIGSVTPGATEGALQSLSVMDSTPSFFSSFAQPNFPSVDIPVLQSPCLSGVSSGFSVFSQAADIEKYCLPSTQIHSPQAIPSRQSAFHNLNLGNNLGPSRNGFKGLGLGGSLPGSPKKPRGPYSPPLGPSPMANELAPPLIPEPTSDPSYSFWSGSTLQEVLSPSIHLRS